MKKYIFPIAAIAAMFVSCSQDSDLELVDNDPKAQAITTIIASTESEEGTRAVVAGTSINWEEADKIGAFASNSEKDQNQRFKPTAYTLEGQGGTSSGTFKNNESTLTNISAIMYPYQEGARFSENGELHYDIPSVQTGVKGSFDKSAAIMYNVSGGTRLGLGVNFLRVNIDNAEVKSLTISSPTSVLSGRIEYNGSTYSGVDQGGLNYVTLKPSDDYFEPGVYYIAVMPGAILTPTISIVVVDDEHHTAKEMIKTASGNLTFASGKNVKDITVNFSGTGYTCRNAVQLWAGGPFFAEYNVGATSATEYGGYYAWGGSLDKVDDHNTGSVALTGDDDTATKLWGTNWCMPSKTDFDNLLTKCELWWSNGYNSTTVKGYEVRGKGEYEDKMVFLPAAGSRSGDNVNIDGCYWTSTPISNGAYYLDLYSQHIDEDESSSGFSVRAVLR